jgi:hypothetical protein
MHELAGPSHCRQFISFRIPHDGWMTDDAATRWLVSVAESWTFGRLVLRGVVTN